MAEGTAHTNTEQTPPRLPARQTLSRLSYSPTGFSHRSSKTAPAQGDVGFQEMW